MQALLEQTAESLENLQVIISRSEEGKHAVNHSLSELANKVETLTDHMRTEQAVMRHLAEIQVEMKPILERLANGNVGNNADEVISGHLRNVDKNMQRLVDESALTRNEITDALRREIRLLARTIAATGDSN